MTQSELLQDGIGRSLKFFGRTGYMVSITLRSQSEDAPDYQIHIDTAASIVFGGGVYTSSAEINDNMAYGTCEFDRKAAEIMASARQFSLEKIFYDDAYCLHLIFSNGLEIHSLAATERGAEMWRIFLSWTADIHLIGRPEGVEEEPSELSQQELDERKQYLERRMAERAVRLGD